MGKKLLLACHILITCIVGEFICGCASNDAPFKIYTGPEKPKSDTVLLKTDYKTFFTDVYGISIGKIWDSEGKLIWKGNYHIFRLNPGIFSFEVYYDTGSGCPSGAIQAAAAGYAAVTAAERTRSVIKTNFEAGREYIVKFKKTGLFVWQWQAQYWIEDVNNGEVVYGMKPAK